MAYVFVADDFTGASDALATLSRGGLRARLFRDIPTEADVTGLDAWGIATDARALGPTAIDALAARIGSGIAPFAPAFVHVKICSTFDSSLDHGNIARWALGLADALGLRDLAVIGGQPSLGRYAAFGTLFARAPDGAIHRIDRHPIMSRHPVTPMHEADLLRHLAALGLNDLQLVLRGTAGAAFPRFYDAVDQADVAAAGRDLLASARRVLVMGASSVAEAWLAAQPARRSPAPPHHAPPLQAGPIFAFAGSRSSLTLAQISAAEAMARLPVAPKDIVTEGAARQAALLWARERLGRGQSCLVYLTAETAADVTPARLALESARFTDEVLQAARPRGLVVAGGDTSSAIVQRLAPDYLDCAGALCPGVPILRARVQGHDLALALKGGQMGGTDFFGRAVMAMTQAPA
ncbi:four-carbon acid sugar kinase family protein [Phaeovulum sp. W22_SRMD_FR3]|uniref:four-carbon acid sugar kinase family protein n=1 Tax=Phaeovulum sp. W22_SRMD_FR3 TaxID=3240274 RepID=UPI003F9E0E89